MVSQSTATRHGLAPEQGGERLRKLLPAPWCQTTSVYQSNKLLHTEPSEGQLPEIHIKLNKQCWLFIYLSTVKHKALKEGPEPAVVSCLSSTPLSGHPISTVDDETQLHSHLGPHQSTLYFHWPSPMTSLAKHWRCEAMSQEKIKFNQVQCFHSVYKNKARKPR